MTDIKPEDLVKRVEDMADFLVGDKGVFLSADVADEHAADLRALIADRARMEKALRGVVDLASDEADFDADEWKQGYDAACDDAANIARQALGSSQ